MRIHFRLAETIRGRAVTEEEALALDYFFCQGELDVPDDIEETVARFMAFEDLENRFGILNHIDYNIQFF